MHVAIQWPEPMHSCMFLKKQHCKFIYDHGAICTAFESDFMGSLSMRCISSHGSWTFKSGAVQECRTVAYYQRKRLIKVGLLPLGWGKGKSTSPIDLHEVDISLTSRSRQAPTTVRRQRMGNTQQRHSEKYVAKVLVVRKHATSSPHHLNFLTVPRINTNPVQCSPLLRALKDMSFETSTKNLWNIWAGKYGCSE